MKIYLDNKLKADLPTDNTKHGKFIPVLEMFIHQEWKTFKIVRDNKEK